MTSMIAPLLFVVAFVQGASQPPKQVEPSNSKKNASDQDKRNTTPPIQITVTTPDKSPAEKETERQRDERQDLTNERIAEANDRIATLTFWLVIVGMLEALGTVAAFWVGIKAANAAKESAGTAERSLKLLNRPYLDADNWRASYRQPIVFQDPAVLTITFDIGNPSPSPARFERITVNEGFGGQPVRFSIERTINATIGPHHSYPLSDSINLDSEQMNLMLNGTLVVRVFGQFEYTDLFTKPRKRVKHFARFCHCHFETTEGNKLQFVAEFVTPDELELGAGLNDEEDWDKYDND